MANDAWKNPPRTPDDALKMSTDCQLTKHGKWFIQQSKMEFMT